MDEKWIQNDRRDTDRRVKSRVTMEGMRCLVGEARGEKWSGALTLTMGEEVVSERGGGAGVTISGAHTVTAQGGAELLHACQSLCREGGCGGHEDKVEGGAEKPPGPGSKR